MSRENDRVEEKGHHFLFLPVVDMKYGGSLCQDKKWTEIRQNSAILGKRDFRFPFFVASWLPIDLSWRLIVKGLMQTLVVVKVEVLLKPLPDFLNALILF